MGTSLRNGWLLINMVLLFMIIDKSANHELCTTGNLRLNNMVLEICNHSEWRTVCDSDWGNLDTAVACKQLGYDGGYTINTRGQKSSTVDPIEYLCTGRESNLQNCVNKTGRSCSGGIRMTCINRNASDPCTNGDIRLSGGESSNEGNVELCTDRGVWSTVSDISWNSAEAVVTCRQLGYTNFIAVPIYNSKYGQTLQPMEYGGLNCRGNESSLHSCTITSVFVDTLSQLIISNERNYAGVNCIDKSILQGTPCTNGTVRLADGYSSNNGFAEVCIDGIWIGICKSSREEKGMEICNQLGYQRYTSIENSFFTSNRTTPAAYVFSRRCRGQLQIESFLDCIQGSPYYGFLYRDRCTDYGVLCCPNDPSLCTFGPVKPLETNPTSLPIVNPTTPPIVNTRMPPSTGNVISLCFRTTATSLILANSADLRGLKNDIHSKIEGCSKNSECSVLTKAAMEDGFLILRDRIQFKFNMGDTKCEETIEKCFEDNPRLQYLNSDLYLDLTLC